ncbi:MAG: hypothetical protein PHR28_02280 [candidate division Zixibacteria bacterium]|nr:hypothetical protein [candidate division Zixibacteria bacterium]
MDKKGPFGLWMGMSLEQVGPGIEVIGRCQFRVKSVPMAHSAFDWYILQITPNCGLSWIRACGKTIQTSVYGIELKSAFEAMESKLAAAYGKYEKIDILLPESIWNKPGEWMQGIVLRERILMAEWPPKNGASLKEPLTSILLATEAIDTTSGYLVVDYFFQNFPAATAEMAAEEDGAL